MRIMRVLPATRYGSWPGPSPNGQRCLAGVILPFLAVAMWRSPRGVMDPTIPRLTSRDAASVNEM